MSDLFGWGAKAKTYEYKAHRFTHASRRLNILANDILRYIDLCESMASTARDLQMTQEHWKTTHSEFYASKNGVVTVHQVQHI